MATRMRAPWLFVYAPGGYARWLALAATATALSMSVLAGWQRGGWFAERFAWIAIGAVLVVSAHLLPALCRSASIPLRCVGAALWGACMVATCYGHATFFLLAQQHAGTNRVEAVMPTVTTAIVPTTLSGRSVAAIAAERATLTTALAVADEQRCTGECPTLRVRRISLAARLDALNAEADDAKRRLAEYEQRITETDHETARRDAVRDSLRADPVTSGLAALLGTTAGRVDLFSGLAFAGVLEGVACLLWFVALQPRDAVAVAAAVTGEVVPEDAASVMPVVVPPKPSPVMASHEAVTRSRTRRNESRPLQSRAMPAEAFPELDDRSTGDLARLAKEVVAGRVRATVADIRRHLGCSQAKAAALRRQLAEHVTTT